MRARVITERNQEETEGKDGCYEEDEREKEESSVMRV